MRQTQTLTIAVVALLLVVPGTAVAIGAEQKVSAPNPDAAPSQDRAIATQNVTGHPNINVFVPENQVTPGTTTSLDVVLINEGNVTNGSMANPDLEREVTTARSLRVELDDIDRSDGEATGEFAVRNGDIVPVREEVATISVSTNERTVATFPDDSSSRFPFEVTVNRNAEPGRYDLPLNVTYNHTNSVNPETGEENRTTVTKTHNVTLVVEETAQFRVVDVDSSARVGATGTVSVTMQNVGSEPARNASVALTSQNSDLTFGQATTSSRFVGGSWESGENRTVSYRVRAASSASPQRYAFEATVTHEDSDGISTQSDPVSLGVTPAPEQSFTVVSTDHDVRVGDESTVAVTLRNEGPVTVRDASVTVRSSTSAITFGGSSSASRYVGAWNPGEARTVFVNATAVSDAETRNYSLEASVAYEDPEGDSDESESLGFGLQPGPERTAEFEASDVSSTLRVGEEGELTGTITNTGDERATNVVVVFETQSGTISALQQEYSVGSLAPGESATFTFDIEASGSANPGPRQFTLRPTYRDGDDRQQQGESFDVRERVQPDQDVFEVALGTVTVERGTTTLVNVTVTNTRNETLESVSAALFADNPISVEEGDAFADSLAPGETTTLTFELSADAGANLKQYPVELDFQYDDSNGDTKLSSGYNVGVSVTESDDSGGGGVPLVLVGGFVVLVPAIGGLYYWSRE